MGDQPDRNSPHYANRNDVEFDDATSDALASACRNAARDLRDKVPGQRTKADTAMVEFKGYFSKLYDNNINTAVDNGKDIATVLDQLAKVVDNLKEAAHKEQKIREDARHYEDDWFGLRKSWDDFWGSAPKLPDPYIPDTTIDTTQVGQREHPTPGAPGGGSGSTSGTSSAKPSDLRESAKTSHQLFQDFRNVPGDIRVKAANFKEKCKWGTIDCENLLTTFDKWNNANDQEDKWATTIADEFAKAGSENTVNTVSNAALQAALDNKSIKSSREDLKVPAPSVVGQPTSSGYANDPVNVATGNFIEEEIDIAFSNLASSCAVMRMYNSLAVHGNGDDLPPLAGVFGPGWSSNLDTVLNFSDEGATWIMLVKVLRGLRPILTGLLALVPAKSLLHPWGVSSWKPVL